MNESFSATLGISPSLPAICLANVGQKSVERKFESHLTRRQMESKRGHKGADDGNVLGILV